MRYLVRFLRICGLVLIAFIGCLGGDDEGCEFDKCEGVVCPPDDNECTREGCSNATGSCTSWPVENGTSCTYNGLSGVCVEGVCGENLCAGDPCDDNDACTDGTCDYVDGTCDFTPLVCDDHNPCTEDTCDPADGCVFTVVEDGTECGSPGWVCVAGECVRAECGSPEDCDDGNDCTEDTCNVFCENPQAEDGTPCAGGACFAGACELTGSVLPCTEQGIRNAIAAGGGPYTFNCEGPQTVMTRATILIDKSVIIDGEGNLTIDAKGAHRVFLVSTDASVEFRGVTITGGARQGIYNEGVLTLTNSAVSGNSAEWHGGGLWNDGTLTLTNSTVSGNSADYSGGGIYNEGVLTLTNSTVSGNTAGEYGGGIRNGGTVTLTNSTVSGNSAGPGNDAGGGIYNEGVLTLMHTTVSGNTARFGGGIYNESALTLTNSTVSGNSADYNGGGIRNGGTVTLTNSTVSGNTASEGGGLWNDVLLWATNTVVDGGCYTGAVPYSGGYNIESPGDTCGFDQSTDQVDVTEGELNLGPLQDNGGPTETHALLPGSVAIDVIPADMCEVDEDQRGEPRPGGTMCDVGAFELEVSQ